MAKKAVLLTVIAACLVALVFISFSGEDHTAPPALPEPDATQQMASSQGLPEGHPSVGGQEKSEAPDFTLDSLDGDKVTLSDLRGKAVVMNFWSSTCGPCIIEMPSFEKLAKLMEGKPFQIITVTSDTRKMAQNTAEGLNMTVPVLLDHEGKVAMQYGVYFTPETVIIDPSGNLDQKITGAANWGDASVVKYLDSLIEKSKTQKEG